MSYVKLLPFSEESGGCLQAIQGNRLWIRRDSVGYSGIYIYTSSRCINLLLSVVHYYCYLEAGGRFSE